MFFQTDSNRALEAVAVISFLQLFNLMSIWSGYFVNEKVYLIVAVLIGLNSLIFLAGSRYKKVVSEGNANKDMIKYLNVAYILISIAAFIYTR